MQVFYSYFNTANISESILANIVDAEAFCCFFAPNTGNRVCSMVQDKLLKNQINAQVKKHLPVQKRNLQQEVLSNPDNIQAS